MSASISPASVSSLGRRPSIANNAQNFTKLETLAAQAQNSMVLFHQYMTNAAHKDEGMVNVILKKQNLRNIMVGDLFHMAKKGALDTTKASSYQNKASLREAIGALKYFSQNSSQLELLTTTITQTVSSQQALMDAHSPQDELAAQKIGKIKDQLTLFSDFTLNANTKTPAQISQKAQEMLGGLLKLIPEGPAKNSAKLFLRDIMTATGKLTNELDILKETKEALIKTFFVAGKEFVDALVGEIEVDKNSPQAQALEAFKNMVNHHISTAVLLASYKEKTLKQKGAILMWRTVAPFSALCSKTAGILGAVAAANGTFLWAAGLSSIAVIGAVLHFVVCSLPFVAPELALMALYAYGASSYYSSQQESIANGVENHTNTFLQGLGITQMAKKELTQEDKEIAEKKAHSTKLNWTRHEVSKVRTLKPGLAHRVFSTNGKHSAKELFMTGKEKANRQKWAQKYEATVKSFDFLTAENSPWYGFIQEVDNKQHVNVDNADKRATLISSRFFDPLIAAHPKLKNKLNELITLSHDFTNKSDGKSKHWIESTQKCVDKLAYDLSSVILSKTVLSAENRAVLKKYLKINIVYFAHVMTSNQRASGSKILRYSGLVLMPVTNFGVLKGESIAVVKYVPNVIGELAVGTAVGALTLGAAGLLTCKLRDIGEERDKTGIHQANMSTKKYLIEHLKFEKQKKQELLEVAKELAQVKANESNYSQNLNYIIDNNLVNTPNLSKLLHMKINESPDKFCTLSAQKNAKGEYKIEYKFIDSLMEKEEGFVLFPLTQNTQQTLIAEIQALDEQLAQESAVLKLQSFAHAGAVVPYSPRASKFLESTFEVCSAAFTQVFL